MILLAVVITVQARMQAQALTMTTLIKAETAVLHRRAIGELVRGDIAMAILRPKTPGVSSLNGQIYEYTFAGIAAQVRLQDVAGYVDIYQSPPDQLALAGFDQSQILLIQRWRQAPIGLARLASLEQTLAVLGLGQEPSRFLTQRRQSGRINPSTAPIEIQERAYKLPRTSTRIVQAREVQVEIGY